MGVVKMRRLPRGLQNGRRLFEFGESVRIGAGSGFLRFTEYA